jgi:cobaltochelatase CobN
MKKLSLSYFTATGMDIASLSAAVELLRMDGLEIEVTARTHLQLFDTARIDDFVSRALAADAVILTLHGGKKSFPAYDRLEAALAALKPEDHRPWFHVQPTSGDDDSLDMARALCTSFGQPAWAETASYLRYGGRQNFHQLLRHIHNEVFGGQMECAAPLKPPFEGIYHPDHTEPLPIAAGRFPNTAIAAARTSCAKSTTRR